MPQQRRPICRSQPRNAYASDKVRIKLRSIFVVIYRFRFIDEQLEGKDLLALGNGSRFLVALRKLATDQYAVVDLDHRRFKVLGNVREAIEEYHARIAWLGIQEWDNKFLSKRN